LPGGAREWRGEWWSSVLLSAACQRQLAGGCPAASNFLLLRQKKVTKEKATLLSAALRLRSGYPPVLVKSGVLLELASLRQSQALIRFCLRSSAHTEGWRKEKTKPSPEVKSGVLEARSASRTGLPTDRHVCTRAQHTRPNEAPFSRPAGRGKGGGLGVGSSVLLAFA